MNPKDFVEILRKQKMSSVGSPQLDYLKSSGFKVDYLISCDTESLEESDNINNNDLLIAVAAHLGSVRLIDNLVISKL